MVPTRLKSLLSLYLREQQVPLVRQDQLVQPGHLAPPVLMEVTVQMVAQDLAVLRDLLGLQGQPLASVAPVPLQDP